jgi:nucleoside-diphosphate-sugar epimerase
MGVFLTGATGHIGAAVLDAFVRHGHAVTALVRNNEKVARVEARGGQPVIGDLSAPKSYRRAAEGHDGYIHTAFDRAPQRGPTADRVAVETLLEEAAVARSDKTGSPDRFFIYTSGIWVLGSAPEPIGEDAPTNPIALAAWRVPHEELVLRSASDSVRTIVVRPGVVYGGGSGVIADVCKAAAQGLVRVVGDGTNHWPTIYDRDLAELYVCVAERSEARGVYHATDESDEEVNEIVAAVGSHLPTPPDVRHVPIEEARVKMGPYADALALDQRVRSPRAHALGWSPALRSVSGSVARLIEEWRRADLPTKDH